ncbi:MAG: thiamine diphosphokinase [Clostridia bacterium]|nr:thiamine diphosphokinase [Clostridia bacterium]
MERKKAFIYTGGTVFDEYVTEKPEAGDLVIAADAGYLTAKRMGITPNILLGDFDTLGEENIPDGVECLRVPAEKNDTDTQLAVSVATERGAEEITIVGGLSGRIDHTLSTLAILEDLWERKENRIYAILTDGKNRVRFIRNSGTILPRSQYRYFSLIAADETVKGITLEGCKYPLKNGRISRRHQWAVSNEITGNCALIEIKRGGVWVIESLD